MTGPLAGVRVLEIGGIGPLPHAGMLLADLGCEVVRIDPPAGQDWPNPVTGRGRAGVLRLDLKTQESRDLVLAAAEHADVLIEGFRPGVMERLGLGPDDLAARNPRLIYGRMTGWGQTGPLAERAGHDICYIALAGLLDNIGEADGRPMPPLNLAGDYGGGSLFLVLGVVSALYARERTGRGQVVDAAIVDGAAALMAAFHGWAAAGSFPVRRGANPLDGSAPFYRTYRCRDGGYMAVGAIEPKFRRVLLAALSLPPQTLDGPPPDWPAAAATLEAVFLTRDRYEWARLLEPLDACAAPVLSLAEAAGHPHAVARGASANVAGVMQPRPAPRFSGGAPEVLSPDEVVSGRDRLAAWGVAL